MTTKYAHLYVPARGLKGYGRLTVAWDQESDLIGYSWCSPKDQFCKKTGREQASDRESFGLCPPYLLKMPIFDGDVLGWHLAAALVLLNSTGCPSWVNQSYFKLEIQGRADNLARRWATRACAREVEGLRRVKHAEV